MPQSPFPSDFFPRVAHLGRRRTIFKPAPTTVEPFISSDPPSAPSSVFPILTRLDLGADMPPPRSLAPEPVLTLLLTNPSFLDAVVSDGTISLYSIETRGARTSIHRTDLTQGSTQVCCIRWPDDSPHKFDDIATSGTTVQMGKSRPKAVEDFLKFAPLFTARRFNLPHYSHSLKWKRTGGSYHLTSSAVKNTIATLEPAVLSAPPRIRVFQSLHERDESRPQLEHRGIPVLLLDYLIVTSLLLLTGNDEWQNHSTTGELSPRESRARPGLLGTLSSPTTTSSSVQEWRHRVVHEQPPSPVSRPSSPCSSTAMTTPSSAPVDTMSTHSSSGASNATALTTPASASAPAPVHPYAYGYTGADAASPPPPPPPLLRAEHRPDPAPRPAPRSKSASMPRPFPPASPPPPPGSATSSTGDARPLSAGGRARRELPRPPVPLPRLPPLPALPPLSLAPTTPPPPPPPPPHRHALALRTQADGDASSPPPPPLPPKLAQEHQRARVPRHSFDLPLPAGGPSSLPFPSPLMRRPAPGVDPDADTDVVDPRQTVYEPPPPAYDSINWAAPQVRRAASSSSLRPF